MKKYLSLLVLCFLNFAVYSQDENKAMQTKEFDALKTISIKNIEKDTYIKTDNGFILDREEKPPYQFKFSDGISRKIYIYQIFGVEELKVIGKLLVYSASGQNQTMMLPIPNTLAGKEVWGLYIDEIKAIDAKASGFATCLAFILTKENNCMGGEGNEASDEEGEEYEYCFPANAQIQLESGQLQAIADVEAEISILAGNEDGKNWQGQSLNKLIIHAGQRFSLSRITLSPLVVNTASTQNSLTPPTYLEATPNHPVLSQRGKVQIKDLKKGDVLYYREAGTGDLIPYQIQKTENKYREVTQVYNLKLNANTYLVNGFVVFSK